MKKNPPVILSIAGSDNSCGAGAQADLKTISALGGYAQTAITCVVAEIPGKVSAIQAMPTQLVAEQIRLSFEAFPIAAIKTGMLHSKEIIRAVTTELVAIKKNLPLVVDPVMVASSGDPLLKRAAIAAYQDLLFPLATIVTPNLDELRILSGMPCRDWQEIRAAGSMLVERFGCAFLLKGGHLRAKNATDVLATKQGFESFSAPFKSKIATHGTGCAFSAAIATGLAQGLTLPESVGRAKEFITIAIQDSFIWPHATALNHFASQNRM